MALWKQKLMQAVLCLRGLTQKAEGSEFFPFYPGICRAPSLTLSPALTPEVKRGINKLEEVQLLKCLVEESEFSKKEKAFTIKEQEAVLAGVKENGIYGKAFPMGVDEHGDTWLRNVVLFCSFLSALPLEACALHVLFLL